MSQGAAPTRRPNRCLTVKHGLALSSPPRAKRNQHCTSEPEPGDGILHVVVFETQLKRSRLWDTAWRHRCLQINVERRDLTPAERVGHRKLIAHEPQTACAIFCRREEPRGLRKAEIAGERHRHTG